MGAGCGWFGGGDIQHVGDIPGADQANIFTKRKLLLSMEKLSQTN